MDLQKKMKEDLVIAMKDRDSLRVEVIRSVITAFTNDLVAKSRGPQGELSEEEATTVIKRLGKQRQDAAEQFKRGDREELAEKEEKEYEILKEYLPEELSDEKIREIAQSKIAELGVEDKSKIGILIGAVMKEAAGQADGKKVKEIVEDLLG